MSQTLIADDLLEVVITDSTKLADGIVGLTVPPDRRRAAAVHRRSHVDVHVAAGVVRQYSLCGDDPGSRDEYRLAILKVEDSRGGSRTVHTRLRPGHFLLISPPKNNFPRSGVRARVEAGQTIAKVLADRGVFVPTSCEEGVCGTCLVRVLQGTPDHRDVFYLAAERRPTPA